MRWTFGALLLLAATVVGACAPEVENREASPPAETTTSGLSRPAPPPPPPPPPPEAVATPSPPSATPAPRSAATTAAPTLQVELSAGVALPQTGPTGMLMSFSVDYRVVEGTPTPTLGHVWVIERQQGPPAREPVRLSDRGTLTVLIPGWRPSDGPFSGHIEDRNGVRLSRSIALE